MNLLFLALWLGLGYWNYRDYQTNESKFSLVMVGFCANGALDNFLRMFLN